MRPRRRRNVGGFAANIDELPHHCRETFLTSRLDLGRRATECRSIQQMRGCLFIPFLRWQRSEHAN